MHYVSFNPHPELKAYIDAYWRTTGSEQGLTRERILPDGCIDIIFNLGEECITDNGTFRLAHEQVYLVGTMTRFKQVSMSAGTALLGVRFKPGAFSHFYSWEPPDRFTDRTVDFNKALAPAWKDVVKPDAICFLDRFFLNRLKREMRTPGAVPALTPLITTIQDHRGRISVERLAQLHYTTARQLERTFKSQAGATPKSFIRLIRFQHALDVIKRNTSGRSLQEIAFECGYYDHAHLANEIREYAGETPSQL